MSDLADEVKLVVFIKIPVYVICALLGLGIVWIALRIIAPAAQSAFGVSP